MVYRPLGRTGLTVSPIGFGAFKIGRNLGIKYPRGYDLPDPTAVERLLNGVLDIGINYIDTAPAYGLSEERIGQAISHRRSEFVLASKVGETFEDGRSSYDFSAAAIHDSVQRSLRRLRTDALDILLLHSDGRDMEILNDTDTVPALQELRRQGLARFIGLSGKTVAGAPAALNWADLLMVEYHRHDTRHAAVMEEAAQAGVGVVVKKGLAAGHLPAEVAVPFVLAHPGVASLVIGGLNLEHFRSNLRLAEGAA